MDGFYLCKGDPRLDMAFAKTMWYWGNAGLLSYVPVPNGGLNGDDSTQFIAAESYGTHTASNGQQSYVYNLDFHNVNAITYMRPIGEQKQVVIRLDDCTGATATEIRIDLEDSGSISASNGAHSSIHYIGSGYYKIVATLPGSLNIPGTNSLAIRIYLCDPSQSTYDISYLGTGVDGVEVWKTFVYLGDDTEHYFPDINEASYSTFLRTPYESVRLYPKWNAKLKKEAILFESVGNTGKVGQHRTGEFKSWDFDIPVIESERAHMVNRWWHDRDLIYFYNGIDHTTYKCAITNKDEPFTWAKKPYNDIMKGKLQLGYVGD